MVSNYLFMNFILNKLMVKGKRARAETLLLKIHFLFLSKLKFSKGIQLVIDFIFYSKHLLIGVPQFRRWSSFSFIFFDFFLFGPFFVVIKRVAPLFLLKIVKLAGSVYSIPFEIKPSKQYVFAVSWILAHVKKRDEKSLIRSFVLELLEILYSYPNNKTLAFCDNYHKEVVKFRAFAHMRW